MGIVVKQIKTEKELRKFVEFQIELYRDNPYFVPPIISDEVKDLNPDKNPVYQTTKAYYFLAYKDGKIAGRIAVYINKDEIEKLNLKKIRFGHFEVINDVEVTKALFEKVEEIAKEYQLEYTEGPMGASNMETGGMLTAGFERPGTVIALYNFDYYPEHLRKLGFKTEKKWVEFLLKVPSEIDEKVYQFAEKVTERYRLELIHFKNRNELKPFIRPIFDLIEESHQVLETFVPLTNEQKDFYAKKYTAILNPEYISLIRQKDGKLIAFAITLPSPVKALQKAKGKLFPFGWFHLLQSQRKNDTAEFILIGVHPEYQRKGVTAIIFKDAFETFTSHGIKYLETNPELESNKSVQALWKDYEPELHKKRESFRKDFKS